MSMENATFVALVEQGSSQREIAREFDCSQSTVKYWLKKFGIKTRPNNPFDGNSKFCCIRCNETDVEKAANVGRGNKSKSICQSCHSQRNVNRFRGYKIQAVLYKGGKCIECGYKRCLAALTFHHRDPSQKDPSWNKLRNKTFEEIKAELDKCDLLCCRCHAELHYPNDDWAGSSEGECDDGIVEVEGSSPSRSTNDCLDESSGSSRDSRLLVPRATLGGSGPSAS